MRVEINSEDLERLNTAISKLGDEAEKGVNEAIHNKGALLLKEDLNRHLPVSVRAKNHAKFSDAWKMTNINLGLEITTKGGSANSRGSYGYLIFPDEGRGSKNKNAQDFTGKGIEDSKPKIIQEIQDLVIQKFEGVL